MKEIDKTLFELQRQVDDIKVDEFNPKLHEQIQESIEKAKLLFKEIEDLGELERVAMVLLNITAMFERKLADLKRNNPELEHAEKVFFENI